MVYGLLHNLTKIGQNTFGAILQQEQEAIQVLYTSDQEGAEVEGCISENDQVCVVGGTVLSQGTPCRRILVVSAAAGGAIVPCAPNLLRLVNAAKHPGFTPGVVDVCVGCGGWAVAMNDTGFSVQAARDISPEAVKCAEVNLPAAEVLEADFMKASTWTRLVQKAPWAANIGTPCPNFSSMGNGSGPFGASGRMAAHIPIFVRATRLPVYNIECVPGLANYEAGHFKAWLYDEASRLGYWVRDHKNCSSDSIPISKKRWFAKLVRSDVFRAMPNPAEFRQVAPPHKEVLPPTL